jgi:hypothetical protein
VERIPSPRRSSPKKKSLRNRKKRDTRSDVIVVDIGDSQYEYNRADLIYDLEQGPVYFASYNAMYDIVNFINDIATLDPGVGGSTYEESEESIHLLAGHKGRYGFESFEYALNGFDNTGNWKYVRDMFNRLMSVYRLYELPDEKDIYLTVNSLDLLRDTKYKEYELVKVGRTKKLTKIGHEDRRELDIYDLLPIGYKGEIPHLVDTKQNKKAYFGTKEITRNLHELLDGFLYNTEGRRKDKIYDLLKYKYEFY